MTSLTPASDLPRATFTPTAFRPAPPDFSGRDLVVVLTTQFRQLTDPGPDGTDAQREDYLRYQLTLDTVQAYANYAGRISVAVMVADSSAPEIHAELADELTSLGAAAVVSTPATGMLVQNTAGLRFAFDHGARFAGRAEPFKNGLAAPGVLEPVYLALETGVDILLVGRDDAALMTLPPVQRDTERDIADFGDQYGLPLGWDPASGIRYFTEAGLQWLEYFAIHWPEDKLWEFMWGVPQLALTVPADIIGLPEVVVDGICVNQLHPFQITNYETGNERLDRKRYDQRELVTTFIERFAGECEELAAQAASTTTDEETAAGVLDPTALNYVI